MTKIHIPIKCSTCKFCAFGYADGENSLDTSFIKTYICSKNKTYAVECPKSARKNGCESYRLNWNIYNKIIKENKRNYD